MSIKFNIFNQGDAVLTNPNSPSPDKIGSLGGSSFGFAADVAQRYAENFYSVKSKPDPFTVSENSPQSIPVSLANTYALYNFKGFYGDLSSDASEHYRDKPNNSLMGGQYAHDVSVTKIIEFFRDTYPRISYKASDFLYCKYYQKIPVNHLVTLRRFPLPVEDNIYSLNAKPSPKNGGESTPQANIDVTQTAGVTAVTYLGETAGNKLDEILNFTYGLNWKELTSEMESISSGDGGYTQQPFYSKIGGIGRSIVDATKGVDPGQKFAASNITTEDRLGTTFANFVLGPVNVVDKTFIRDRGLSFQNDLKLTFEYELKSLNYVNPKIAMIDIMSNMLTMTTNNAAFWGGGHRYYGSSGYVANQFGDIAKLRKGDFAGYMGSVVSDVETGFKGLFGNSDGGFSPDALLKGGLKAGKTLLGNVLGGFLGGQIGGPVGTQATKAFISGEATGNWHVTVGNPLNPIVTIGNMYCDNTVMTLGKGLGYDDFPMELKFEVEVKHGKPRDKGDIENMFNAGKGRIYASANKTEDILNLSGKNIKTYGSIPNVGTQDNQRTQSDPEISNRGEVSAEDIGNDNLDINSTNQNSLLTSDDPEYVSNLVGMIIDS